MSRIGNAPIKIPSNVTVSLDGSKVTVSGSLGNLDLTVPQGISTQMEGEELIVKRANNLQNTRSLHGLTRSLISNMVLGVDKGWSKQLELVGVGYRAQTNGTQITLNVGF